MTSGSTFEDPPASQRSATLTRMRVRWYVSLGLIGGVLGGALAFGVTPLLPTTYTAQSQVVVRSPSEVTVFGNAVAVNVSTVSSPVVVDVEIFRHTEMFHSAARFLYACA